MPSDDSTATPNSVPASGAAEKLRSPARRTDEVVIDQDLRVRIYRSLASPVWCVQYNLPGTGQRRETLGTRSKEEARSRARKIARDLEAGMLTNKSNRAVTIAQAAERYLNFLSVKRRRNQKSIINYRRCLDQLVCWGKAAGVVTLPQLTTSALERFEATLRNQGVALPNPGTADKRRQARPNAAKTLRDKMKTIRSLIKWALKMDMVGTDPSRG